MRFKEISAAILCVFMLSACGGGGGENSTNDVTYRSVTECRAGVYDPSDDILLSDASVNTQLIDNETTTSAYIIPENTTNHTLLIETNSQSGVNRVYIYITNNWQVQTSPLTFTVFFNDFLGAPWARFRSVSADNPVGHYFNSAGQRIELHFPSSITMRYIKLVTDNNKPGNPAIDVSEVRLAEQN